MANPVVGVNLVEGAGISPIAGVNTAISGLLGTFERGTLNKATLVSSMSQFESLYGLKPAANSTSWYSVKAFFRKASSAPLYIVRVANTSSAALATFNFVDSGAAITLRIDSKDEGIWGNALSVQVSAFSILSTKLSADISVAATSATLDSVEGLEVGSDIEIDDTTNTEFRRILAINAVTKEVTWATGLTNAFTIAADTTIKSQEVKLSLFTDGVLTEEHTGIGMNPDTTFFAEKKVVSAYIVATDIKVSKVNSELDLPDVIVATSLASGTDGLAAIVEADWTGSQASKTGIFALDAIDNLFRFVIPNPLLTNGDIPAAFIAITLAALSYADSRVTVQYYADVPFATSVANAKVHAQVFTGRRIAMFWPWLKVIEGGLVKWLPPSSFVLGAAVEKDFRRGVYKNPANETLGSYATDLEYAVTSVEGDNVNDFGVNVIRKFAGRGIRLYGGRTLSPLTVWRFINYSEYWNYIGKTLEISLQNVPFEPHTDQTWKAVVRRVTAFMEDEQAQGALFDVSDPTGTPYLITMDATNNTPSNIALGIANLKIEYVPVGTIEKFVVEVKSSPAGLTINS